MTQLGKVLVFLNLVLSIVFVAWAVGLVTNQVPWSTPPSTDGQRVQGMVDELRAEIDRLTRSSGGRSARDAADANWAAGVAELNRLERDRPTNQRFYQDLLRSARQGGVQGIDPPVQQLQFQNNQLVLNRTGRPPVAFDGRPALSVAGYEQAKQETLQKFQQAQAEVQQLSEEEKKLTLQIVGTKPPGQAITPEEKGLRLQLAELDALVKNLQLEQQYLRSPLTYFTLQTEQLRRRQAALAARMDELGKATTALGVRP
jgi:hypothetical protein